MSRKQYINRRPQITIEQILDDISFSLFSLNQSGVLNNQTRFGKIPVGAQGVRARVETNDLDERHTLYIINDSSFIIFMAQTEDAPQNEKFAIPSGTSIEVNLNPAVVTPVWLFSPFFDLNIELIEVA